jgi:hypothetical protein
VAEFSLPLTAEGAVSAPAGSLALTVPTAESVTFLDVGPVTALEIPDFGWALADGVNPLRLVTRSAVYNAGGIGPAVAPTLAAGARATATLTNSSGTDFANNDRITLYQDDISPSSIYADITLKTTLTASGAVSTHEVKRGTSVAATLTAIYHLVNGTGTEGVDYVDAGSRNSGILGGSGSGAFWPSRDIEASAVDATTVTFRAKTFGTGGNAYIMGQEVDSGGVYTPNTPTAFSGGSVGTGTAPAAGTYRYFTTWYRDADGAETWRSPVATITKTSNVNVTVSALTDSADATFDYIRIYRTEKQGVEFFLVGTVARGSTSFTDDVDDDTLARSLPWNDLTHRAYEAGMPPRGLALALWKGSVWTLGAHRHADYVRGTVSVTAGSDDVTFSVKGVTERHVGRTLQIASTSEEYTILSVDEANRTAVIDRGYEGVTNGTASFTILDDIDTCAFRRSVPFQYSQWPEDESPGRIDTDDIRGGLALLATRSRLFGFSRTSIAAVTGDGPESWEISKVAQGIGCVATRMVVGVEDGGIFLSYDGFYAISPDESMVSISSPKTPKRTLAQGIDGTVSRIAWAHIDQGYAEYDPTDRVVVFGVPLDGATTPNYEIVFDLQNSTWTLYKRAEWTALTRIVLPGGGQALLSGDRDGNLWHVGIGESDGLYGTEAVRTLSGAQTVRVLTVSGTPFSTSGDGEEGKPVIVLYADGSTVAYGKVASNTSSALTLAEDLATAPSANDQIVLGGIAWQAKSGFTTFGEEYRTKTLRSVTVRHSPTTRGEYFLSFAVNGGSFSLCPVGTSIGSLSEADGKAKHFVQWPGDAHAVNLRGFKPGGRAVLRGGVFDLSMREVGTR